MSPMNEGFEEFCSIFPKVHLAIYDSPGCPVSQHVVYVRHQHDVDIIEVGERLVRDIRALQRALESNPIQTLINDLIIGEWMM